MRTFKLFSLRGVVLVSTLFAIDLPAAPDGYTWQEIPEIKAAFLKPVGWYFKREEQKDTLAYFITKQNIEQNGEFQTGLTINVFRKPKKSAAIDQARDMIKNIAAKYHPEKGAQQVGPLSEFGCLVKETDASGTTVGHYLTVANPKTNTMYLFIFESPESEPDAAWKTGKTIMDKLALDDET